MNKSSTQMILKRFDQPDETREMELGSFEVVRIGGTRTSKTLSATI